ncbi:SpoIIE family protein phosphatase [Streptomyces samsunensis]|uniref:SpoIIE family protein phosphatase n=1 Tax=Streptomyces malaysiensis TaxID=92644 RepID=UPI0015816805|nr:SpoIIE family protein phosphatase [Streptomyces samsunensis]NUH43252.1 SpoIIE family protein phosphatase [Streptomyces samsunensis]
MNPRDSDTEWNRPGPLETRHTATVLLDETGEVIAWSPGASRLLGYSAAEAEGRSAEILLAAGESEAVRRFVLGAEAGAMTAVLRGKDGQSVTVELVATPSYERSARSASGHRLLVLTPLMDTRRELLEWSFDQFPFIAGITDLDLRYIRLNKEAGKAFQATEADLVGRTTAENVGGPEGDRIQQAMRLARDTGESASLDIYVKLPNEQLGYAWQGHFVPLKDARGRVRGMYAVGLDAGVQHLARERLALLNQASTTVGSTLDVARTAQELAEVLVPGIADFVTVDLLESVLTDEEPEFLPVEPGFPPPSREVTMRRMAQHSVWEGAPEAVLNPGDVDVYPSDGPHVRVLVTGESYMVPPGSDASSMDWVNFSERRMASTRAFGLHSAMIVPLRARGTLLGLAVFIRHQKPQDFDSDDLLLAEEITTRAAVSLDNALRFTRQRATALALQHSLLPQRLPEQTAVEAAGRYLPADTKAGVGGDWYDLIPLSGARVALVVGDVVGHGLRASATMGRLRTAVRTLSDIEMPPDELLAQLDVIVGRPIAGESPAEGEPEADTGASCLYAVYDPVSRRCTLARAGHPPPLLAYPDGRVESVAVPVGPPLGLGGFPFESVEVELPEDSLLVLYTDGLIRTRDGDLDERREMLRRSLIDAPGSLEGACDAVLRTMLPDRAEDDIALLLARTRSLDCDQVATWELPMDPEAVAEARDLTTRQLSDWGLEEATFTTELIVSELVTNAIRYASGPIGLRLILQDTLICEVADSSDTYPHLRQARIYDEGGRGLMLVAQLSERWGTRPTSSGKIIWADQSLPPRVGRSAA